MRTFVILALLALAACASSPDAPGASDAGRATGDGVVQYDGFRAARAVSGDTVESLARRVGVSPSLLGAHNGLPASHPLREGDELVIPPGA